MLVLDGAAGTYLELLGAKSHPTLWGSGTLLTEEGQEMVKEMHGAYIAAGADVITSITYQTSIESLKKEGLTEQQCLDLMAKGVHIAKDVARPLGKLVAAGLGPYGAYLSGGEEYTGDYGSITFEGLLDFWEPRVRAVLSAEPDFLLFETIPNFLELQVITERLAKLADEQQIPVWISLSLNTKGTVTLADGTAIDQLRSLDLSTRTIGANCFDVSDTAKVLNALGSLGRPMIVYPNSGEIYDGKTKQWTKLGEHGPWEPAKWVELGAVVIGGCCRTTPETIRMLNSII